MDSYPDWSCPGPFAPVPETWIGGVRFSWGFINPAVPGVRLTLGDADTLVDCCSSRRKFASDEEELDVLGTPDAALC